MILNLYGKVTNRFLNSDDKKRLLSNFISLFILQGANYILPLITFPYLVRVLGVEKYGLLAFANSTVAYFHILTDYGFNLSATRDISIHRENKEKVEEIFSSVMIIKFGLLILSFVLLIMLIFSFDKFRKDWEVFVLSFGTVLGQVLFPVWFFQGMEKMKYITFLNILSKLIFTIAIFVFIKNQSDYWKVPLLNSIGFVLAGVLALWIVFRDFGIGITIPGKSSIKQQLIEGWHIFIISIQSSILSSTSVFVLGLFASEKIVGYYSAIEKLVKAFVYLFTPITQAVYPLTSKKLHENKQNGIIFLVKLALFTCSLALFIAIILIVFSKEIILLVLGNEFSKYSIIMQILSVWLFFGVVNNFIGIQFLVGESNSNIYLKSFNIASLITLLIYFGTTWKYLYMGVVLGMVIGEITLTICMLYFIRRYKLWQ